MLRHLIKINKFTVILIFISFSHFAEAFEYNFKYYGVGPLLFFVSNGRHDFSDSADRKCYENSGYEFTIASENFYAGLGLNKNYRDYYQTANSSFVAGNFASFNDYYYLIWGLRKNITNNFVLFGYVHLGFQNYTFKNNSSSEEYNNITSRIEHGAGIRYHLHLTDQVSIYPFISGHVLYRNTGPFEYQGVVYNGYPAGVKGDGDTNSPNTKSHNVNNNKVDFVSMIGLGVSF